MDLRVPGEEVEGLGFKFGQLIRGTLVWSDASCGGDEVDRSKDEGGGLRCC